MLWASTSLASDVDAHLIRQLESNVVSIYSRKYVDSPIRQLESNVVSILFTQVCRIIALCRQLESNVVSIYSRKYVDSPIRQLESNVVSIYSRKYVAHPSGS